MNDTTMIDSCQAHMPVQYGLNIERICKKWHWCCDWQRATPALHMQNKPLACSIGSPRLRWLFRFSVLYSDKAVNMNSYYIQNCFVSLII